MRLETVYQTKNRCYIKGQTADQVGILVHSTGAVNKNVKRYVDAPELLGVNQYGNHWNSEAADKCMHAFIGLDKDGEMITVETLPYEYACWGSGKGKNGSYNYNPTAHVQFEICQGSNADEAYYRRAIKEAEEYCAYLCRKFGWKADRITSHKEAADAGYASNHGDPQSWMKNFGDDMDQFRARVAALLGEETEDQPMREYEVTGGILNLRKGMSTSTAVLARMATGTRVQGVEAGDGWVQVQYGNLTGYSMAQYLRAVEEAENSPLTPSPAEPTDAEKLGLLWAWYKEEHG